MPGRDSRGEYEARMHRVLAHIDRHLEQPLELADLARVACFSPFHFHRLFAAWMGETFGDYLRRRRVEVAAMRLAAQPQVKILPLALSVGFGSAEAFARAFKARFGSPPSLWRERQRALRGGERNPDQANSNPDQAGAAAFGHHGVSPTPQQEIAMDVNIIERQPVTVAYLRHLGPYGDAIAHFWQEQYVPWARLNRFGPDHARYGIGYDDPSVTAPEQCRYDACAAVAPDYTPLGGGLKMTIPGGKYAALSFYGTVEQIGAAWTALLRDWLPASGLQLDARPCFEFYRKGARCDGENGNFECEICVPISPL